jgi:hypothetical protein
MEKLCDFTLTKESEVGVDHELCKGVMWLIVRGNGRKNEQFEDKGKFPKGKWECEIFGRGWCRGSVKKG